MDLSDDSVVVGEGRWQIQEPKALVNGLPLGPKAVKVFLDVVREPETFLWSPTLEVAYLEDCVMTFISWPAHKVVFENQPEARRKVSPAPKLHPQLETQQKQVLKFHLPVLSFQKKAVVKKVENQEQQHQLLLLRSLPQCR